MYKAQIVLNYYYYRPTNNWQRGTLHYRICTAIHIIVSRGTGTFDGMIRGWYSEKWCKQEVMVCTDPSQNLKPQLKGG